MSAEPALPRQGAYLQGLRVLNPRPAVQAAGLSDALRAAGAEVIELPLLSIVPMPLSSEGRACLLALDRYDAVVFVSPNAARLGLDAVADFWPQWPWQLPAYAVGAATAALLADAGLPVTRPDQEDSEGLLALSGLQDVGGQRWLLLRGDEGRELLPDTLRARGAQVDVVSLYVRQLPALATAQWAELSFRPDAVLLSSRRVWQHWQSVAGAEAMQPLLVAVSDRLAESLREAGARHVVSAQGAHPQDWLRALSCWRAADTRGIQ